MSLFSSSFQDRDFTNAIVEMAKQKKIENLIEVFKSEKLPTNVRGNAGRQIAELLELS